MMKNKKILMMCKETYSYPLYFLAQKWKENNEVAAFFFMPPECVYSECLLNKSTYYAFVRLGGVKIYDSIEIANAFTDNIKSPKVNMDKLHDIEKKYTFFKSINLQIMSSQFMTRPYHFRNYYSLYSDDQALYWLQLNYELVEKILDEYEPDMIIDCDDAELPRTVMAEVANRRNIPYITVDHMRYEDYKIATRNLGYQIEEYFYNEFNKCYELGKEYLKQEIEYVDNFRQKESIMSEKFKDSITSKYEGDNITTIIKRLIGKIIYFEQQDRAGKNRRIKAKNPLLYPNSWEYIKFYFRTELFKAKLYNKNSYFKEPVQDEAYVYMPLHLIPESTTFIKAPYYVNELTIIEAISKALPLGWKLYVKEHQAMLGERGKEFYQKVNSLNNVQMVQFNYYKDPKPWILNAKAVVTISGTTAYEAALLGRKAFVFSNIPFSLINRVVRVNSVEQLADYFVNIEDETENDILSVAAYIKAVKNVGKSVRLAFLLKEGEEIMLNGKDPSDEYLKEIDVLGAFFEEAYERYLNVESR